MSCYTFAILTVCFRFRVFGQNMKFRFFMCNTQMTLFINLPFFLQVWNCSEKTGKMAYWGHHGKAKNLKKKLLLYLCSCTFCNVLRVENKKENCTNHFLYFLLFILFETSNFFVGQPFFIFRIKKTSTGFFIFWFI